MAELAKTPLLFLDCQTTGLSPKSDEVLEMGWSLSLDEAEIQGTLVRPSRFEGISSRVWEITGLSETDFAEAKGVVETWKGLVAKAQAAGVRAVVIHYASFETSFLKQVHESAFPETKFPWPIICTYRLAQRVTPDLPSKTLRAISGFLGHVLPPSQRAQDHARATLKVWQFLLPALAAKGITEWADFLAFWGEPKKKGKPTKKSPSFLVTKEKRKALPKGPGIYQMCSEDGTILYVGKATSLRSRVASYFQLRKGDRQKLPELMTQVNDVRVIETETALEAALLETDTIKELNPFYNTALRTGNRRVFFYDWDLENHSPGPQHPLGPFLMEEVFESVGILKRILTETTTPLDHSILTHPPEAIRPVLESVLTELGSDLDASAYHLSRLGKRLKPPPEPVALEDDSDEPLTEEEQKEEIRASIFRKLRRPNHHIHRARWLTWFLECRVLFKMGQAEEAPWRYLVFCEGKQVERGTVSDPEDLPPFRRRRSRPELRRKVFQVADYDRMRVLMTELEIIAKKNPVTIEFSSTRRLSNQDRSWLSRVLTQPEMAESL